MRRRNSLRTRHTPHAIKVASTPSRTTSKAKFPAEPQTLSRVSGLVQLKGVYRVCVGTDGKVALVVALQPAGRSADPYIKESIANGWRYKPLAKPACFAWRVTLFFGVPAPNPTSPIESAPPTLGVAVRPP